MSPHTTFPCPRCGERLPEGFTRCDSCGAYIVAAGGGGGGHAPAQGQRPRKGGGAGGGGRAAAATGMPPWAFLIIGLVVGGAVGYSLRAAVTPRMEGGMPTGPADIMAGGGSGGDAMGGGMGGGMPSNQMLPGVIEALAKYRNTLAEDPNNLEANIGMGNLMFDSNKWDKAIEHYSKALEVDPKNPDVRVDRGIAYHSIGRNQEALDDFKIVTKEQPAHKNAWLNLGVVAGAVGDRKTNIAAWEQYLKLEPSGPHSDAIRQELNKVKAGA